MDPDTVYMVQQCVGHLTSEELELIGDVAGGIGILIALYIITKYWLN